MKAKELIKRLQKLVKENGDIDILISDPESSWYNTINDTKVIMPYGYYGNKSLGIKLEVGIL